MLLQDPLEAAECWRHLQLCTHLYTYPMLAGYCCSSSLRLGCICFIVLSTCHAVSNKFLWHNKEGQRDYMELLWKWLCGGLEFSIDLKYFDGLCVWSLMERRCRFFNWTIFLATCCNLTHCIRLTFVNIIWSRFTLNLSTSLLRVHLIWKKRYKTLQN